MLTRLKRKFQDIRLRKFRKIKLVTDGYLSPEVYSAIYSCSCGADEGYMIDIGPAQGGSSISLCLGIKDSKKSRSKVFSMEKGKGSSALVDRGDVEVNSSIFQKNIAEFGVSEYSTILMGDVSDVYSQVSIDMPLSLIFIDADGALDRDFNLFYNRLLPNSPVIIDDYVDIINQYAQENYLHWKTREELRAYVANKGADHFYQLCPLGKEYTTYRFINFFIEQGLITQGKIIGNTFFGYKSNKGHSFTHEHLATCHAIRLKIERDYYKLNLVLKPLSGL